MHTRSKIYRVPVRTHEIRLNCSVSGNPLPQVQWYFLPSEQLKSALADTNRAVVGNNASTSSSSRLFGFDEIELSEMWKSINLVAAYSYRHVHNINNTTFNLDDAISQNSSSYSIVKLPLSKYQIFERRNVNHVFSTLEIKVT